MLNFEKKREKITLVAKDGDIEVSIWDNYPWDRKNDRESDLLEHRVLVQINNDDNHNSFDFCCKTEIDAKIVAQEAVNLFKTIRPYLFVDNQEIDREV